MIEKWIESGLERPLPREVSTEVQRVAAAARREAKPRAWSRKTAVVGGMLALALAGGGTVTAAAAGLWHWDREFAREGTFTSQDGVRCTWGVNIAESAENPDDGSNEAREPEAIPVHIEIGERDVERFRALAEQGLNEYPDDPDIVGMTARERRAAIDQTALLWALDEQIAHEIERLDVDGYKDISGWTECD